MTYSTPELIKLIHDTHAVKIWNHKTGPVFWYAASVPGPFYVNTEFLIGENLANQLLENITKIIKDQTDAATRAAKIEETVMAAYEADPIYRKLITTMVAKAQTDFAPGAYDLVSGGERRDWLFSIPVAKLMGIRHLYLFKNHEVFCAAPYKTGEKALHVADLINNAASHFDAWFPILETAKITSVGTLCVNTRGANGLNRLKEVHHQVAALNAIDIGYFAQLETSHLIDADTLEELRVYFESSQTWAARYLVNDMDHLPLFALEQLDAKSLERLKNFFNNDPWNLAATHAAFFNEMKKRAGAA